jgi:hypothetical protein
MVKNLAVSGCFTPSTPCIGKGKSINGQLDNAKRKDQGEVASKFWQHSTDIQTEDGGLLEAITEKHTLYNAKPRDI